MKCFGCARGRVLQLTTPSNSAPSPFPVAGMSKYNMTSSSMDCLRLFRTKLLLKLHASRRKLVRGWRTSSFESPRLTQPSLAGPCTPEPMQVDQTRLSPGEKQRRRDSNAWGTWALCLAVSSKRQSSPVKGRLLVSVTPLHPLQAVRTLVSAMLITSSQHLAVSILIDSGADGNFIAASLATELHFSSTRLQVVQGVNWITTCQYNPCHIPGEFAYFW